MSDTGDAFDEMMPTDAKLIPTIVSQSLTASGGLSGEEIRLADPPVPDAAVD